MSNYSRIRLLVRLYRAVKAGVEATEILNGKPGNFLDRIEARKQVDSAWAEIRGILRELDG